MHIPASQRIILDHLKQHGAQSVKVLARHLDMTTMGIRQHLAEMQANGLVNSTVQARQTRGRPMHLWELTIKGHDQFTDGHRDESVALINVIREELGESGLERMVDLRCENLEQRYRTLLAGHDDLPTRIQILARLRTADGFMADVRMLPNQNWLLIENHCPIRRLAETCHRYCHAELRIFQNLLADQASVTRTDYRLHGDRRCAYRIARRDQ